MRLSRRRFDRLVPIDPSALGSGLLLLTFLAPALGQEAVSSDVAKKESLPGRIFLVSHYNEDNPARGLLAIDPNQMTWSRLMKDVDRNAGRISPDGTKYAWLEPGRGSRKISAWVADLQGEGKPVRIFEETRFGRGQCCWSADGRDLLVSASEDVLGRGKRQTWRVAIDGSKATELEIPENRLVLDWSPDGRWLVVSLSRPTPDDAKPFNPRDLTTPSLFREAWSAMHPDGTGERPFKPADGEPDGPARRTAFLPRFSPDGRSLLWVEGELVAGEDRAPGGPRRVVVQDLDGDSPREIVGGDFKERHPSSATWSPDGRFIVVNFMEGYQEGKPNVVGAHIEVFDREGRSVRTLRLPGVERPFRGVIDWR